MKSSCAIIDIVKKRTNKNCDFLSLEKTEQREILEYIEKYKKSIRVFEYKWYDILTNKFYANEFVLSDDSPFGIQKKEIEFDNFDDFYKYVKGDIYNNACFYGYSFDETTIKNYSLNIKKINFNSLIDETIDCYSFDDINSRQNENDRNNANRAKEMCDWIKNIKPPKKLKVLESQKKLFCEKFNIWEAKTIFFSLLKREKHESIRQAILDFVCKNDIYDGVGFDDVLVTYGNDAAQYIIANFKGNCSEFTQKRRIKSFIEIIDKYNNGILSKKRMSGFDSELQLFYVRDNYLNDNYCLMSINEYFETFEEYVSYMQGDLTGANLSKAPIKADKVTLFKTDESTKLPLSKEYKTYEVIKKYDDGEFIVKQKWYDASNQLILKKGHEFKRFFDFVHFLKGDLTGADLLLCDGLENIKNITDLKLKDIVVRSEVAERLELPIRLIPTGRFQIKCFEVVDKNETITSNELLTEHPEDSDYTGKISYITDIHLLHRLEAYKCKTPEDVNYVLRAIAKTICNQATGINLIGGDTSSDFGIFEFFIKYLVAYRKIGDFFFTLGNHELWGLNGDELSVIIKKYNNLLEEHGQNRMHLVHNNLFFNVGSQWIELTEEELSKTSFEELREKTREAKVTIFGGVGFAGMNEEFNAKDGIYMDVLDREREAFESNKFLMLYEKVTNILKDKNLVVLTHMPMKDWGGCDIHAKNGIVYINGHSHRNFFYDDGNKRIYADNQVGYKGKKLSLKQVSIDFNYDWFADYKDGIHEINKHDYEKFYRGIGECLTFNRQYEKLYLIKREGTYMFFMKTPKGSTLILNGGAIKKAGKHSLDYFYENMVNYSKSVSMFLSKYDTFQKKVSSEIKKIGGDGRIHGSIIDIDFYNHLYLNPLDGSITPYFAYSMVDKFVYDNIPSLLKHQCPKIFENYEKEIEQQDINNSLVILNKSLKITKNEYYVNSTEMYKISRILKGLQFTTKYNIIRLWNDEIIADASEENGRLIVSGIIDPDFMTKEVINENPSSHRLIMVKKGK